MPLSLDGSEGIIGLDQLQVVGVVTANKLDVVDGLTAISIDSSSGLISGVEEIHIGSANTAIIRQNTTGEIRLVHSDGTEESVGIGSTTNINTTGIITAASFVGDGSGLTNLAVSSAVTSVNAQTGIINLGIQDMNDYSLRYTVGASAGTAVYQSGVYSTTCGGAKWSVPASNRICLQRYDAGNGDKQSLWTTIIGNPTGYAVELRNGTTSGAGSLIIYAQITSAVSDGNGGIIITHNGSYGPFLDASNPPGAGNFSGYVYFDFIGSVATQLADGDILQYVSSDSLFKPTSLSIDSLSDVDTSTVAPTDNQTLLWDNTAQKWEPGTITSGTTLPSAQDGEALIYENGQWVAGPVIGGVDYNPSSDPDFGDVAVLLRGNAGTGTSFTDESLNAFSMTKAATALSAPTHSSTIKKFGLSSIYLSNDRSSVQSPKDPIFNLGSKDFTIETWYYPEAKVVAYPTVLSLASDRINTNDQHDQSFYIGERLPNTVGFSAGLTGIGNLTGISTVSNGQWYHVAVVRNGTTITLYVNGVAEDTLSSTASVTQYTNDAGLFVGARYRNQFTAYNNESYIDDLRVTIGTARYTANFTPPTTEAVVGAAQVTIPYSIDKLDDVDTSTVAPTDGQALLWDNTAQKWEPGSIAAGTAIENNRVETFTYEVTYYGGNAEVPSTPGESTVRNSNPALVRFNAQDKAGKDLLLTSQYSNPSSITIKRNGSDATYPLTEFITQGGYFQIRTTNTAFALGDTLEFNFTRPAEGDYAALKADLTSYETVSGDVVRDIKLKDKLLTSASTVGHVYDSFQAGSPGSPTADGQYAIRYSGSGDPLIRVWPNDTNGNAMDLHTVSYTGATGTNQKPFFYAWADGILYKIPISSQIYSQSGYYQWYCAGGANELLSLQTAGSFRIVHPWDAYEDPQDGDVLTYDSTNKTYHPKTANNVAAINDLSDVDTSTVAATDGQTLLWDNTAQKWEPGTISTGTSLPAAQDGEALIYENGQWVAGPVIGGVDYFTGAGDQYISNVALLMNFEGTDGTQVFTDSSPNNLTLTPNGSASNLKISTTQYKYGSSSGYFFMTYLTASSTIAFNSDPFTVEAWIYRVEGQSYSSSTGWTYGAMEGDIYSARPGITFKINGSNQLEFFRGNVLTPVISSTTTIPLDVWTHVAVTRDSSDVITLWINGVSSATQTYVDTNGVGYDIGTGGTPAIGRRNGSSTSYFFGYIDDLRVTPGVCRYTADFTPPTAQLSSQLPTQTTIPSTTSRSEVSVATTSIANGAYANLTIPNTGKAGQILSIQTDNAAWATVYVSQATRTADLSRTETTDPAAGSGVVAEVITTGPQTVLITPSTMYFNNESTPANELYLKVVNKSGITTAITATLKVIPSEL